MAATSGLTLPMAVPPTRIPSWPRRVKNAYMASETSSAAKPARDSVVLASFDSYRHAEQAGEGLCVGRDRAKPRAWRA